MIPLLACADPGDAGAAAEADRLLILVVDGARVDDSIEPGGEMTALLERLLPQGAWMVGAINAGVTLTVDAHVELLSGRRQALGNFPPGDHGAWRSDTPTLLELFAQHHDIGRDEVGAVGNSVLLAEVSASRYPGLGWAWASDFEPFTEDGATLSDEDSLDAVKQKLMTEDVRALLVNLHHADGVAHDGGDYRARLGALEEPVAGFWAWLQATPPYAGHTTLVVMADHGRHRWGSDGDWQDHGDQCNGCRALPLFVLGPQLPAGIAPTRPVTLPDLSSTLAYLLGFGMPWSEGVVIEELLPEGWPAPDRGSRLGDVAGGRVASVRALNDWDRHSVVEVDGTQLSSDDALLAEAPRLLALPDGLIACWRELVLDPARLGESAWAGRCAQEQDGAWIGLELPMQAGSAAWTAALAADGAGGWWLADDSNFEGYPDPPTVRPRLLHDGVELDDAGGPELALPTGAVLLDDGEGRLLAFAASGDASDGRDTRQIQVWRVDSAWNALAVLDPPEGSGRIERPALWPSGAGWRIAALDWPLAGGVGLVAGELGADGEFSGWTRVDGDRVLGAVAPRYGSDGRLWWARRDEDGGLRLCGDGDCQAVEADAVDDLRLDGDQPWLSVADGWSWSYRSF